MIGPAARFIKSKHHEIGVSVWDDFAGNVLGQNVYPFDRSRTGRARMIPNRPPVLDRGLPTQQADRSVAPVSRRLRAKVGSRAIPAYLI